MAEGVPPSNGMLSGRAGAGLGWRLSMSFAVNWPLASDWPSKRAVLAIGAWPVDGLAGGDLPGLVG